ncbi:hypothetical protein QYE76_021751 [Lolium multiflorum]|uniref:Reverse transcriptase domain-containing protein n=1 Tax=Lolium multiflorum TaxID=4521 RepID=A0AAD8VR68_LOLMU|nr:hypothetical protein QYE76_021751 [Lolium multiflorum]
MKAEVLEEVKKEIKKMLDAGFIRPCRVPGSVGLFEYVVMTFGLKNAGATYQRAMNYIFHDLIGKLVEIYIDDVVVKSVATDGHLEDLRQVLDRTRKFGLRMNPKKCAFGVTAGQFLGFLVHERGIEIGLKSQEAVRTMKPPTTKKELQCLIGKINFVEGLSPTVGRIEPFMGLVKIKPDEEFRLGAEQQQAFDDIKEYLTKPPVLVPPRQDRPFYIYLSVADTSIAWWWCRGVVGLPYVVSWSNKTTPYQLVYGQEAVLPWEVKAGSRRVTFQNDLTAEEYAALISDSIEDATELRLWSLEKIKENKAKVARAYNKKVKPKEFQVDDLLDGVKFPMAVNGQHLKKYFPSMWDDGQ